MTRSFEQLAASLNGNRGIILALDPGETTGYAVFRDFRLVSAGQFPSGHLSLAWNNMVRLISGIQGVPFSGWEVDPGAKFLRAPELRCPKVPKGDGDGDGDVKTASHGFPQPEAGFAGAKKNTNGSPFEVVIEDYRVYSFKLDTHKFSNVYTIKVLTTYELLAAQAGAPVKLTLAQLAKTFCTDSRLQEWGFWLPAMRHARDAIRHATYYIVHQAVSNQTKSAAKPTFQN